MLPPPPLPHAANCQWLWVVLGCYIGRVWNQSHFCMAGSSEKNWLWWRLHQLLSPDPRWPVRQVAARTAALPKNVFSAWQTNEGKQNQGRIRSRWASGKWGDECRQRNYMQCRLLWGLTILRCLNRKTLQYTVSRKKKEVWIFLVDCGTWTEIEDNSNRSAPVVKSRCYYTKCEKSVWSQEYFECPHEDTGRDFKKRRSYRYFLTAVLGEG